ncbi:MAG: NAD-dependent epimerase/dehydratase family protein [Desulfacinum sp.]|jgi:nucleoside-diphosphate-sugar epimerase|nr:NAD-dependent epimerase/dehydratase family protein [Desulfacinum sp.]
MKTVVVTGAGGFIGRSLCRFLEGAGWSVEALGSREADICRPGRWERVVGGARGVVHAAACQEPPAGCGPADRDRVRRVNVEGTRRVVRACVEGGVGRLVFLSSVKVMTGGGREFFRDEDPPAPEGIYGQSKLEAERAVMAEAAGSGLETVILRFPLVYGPAAKGNLARLAAWIAKRRPLPFGAVENRRRMLYLENALDVIGLALVHPDAAGRTFLAGDDRSVSTAELVRFLARGLGRRPFLVPCPPAVLRAAAAWAGRAQEAARLLGSCDFSTERIRRILHWTPRVDVRRGLEATGRWFAENGF